MPQRFGANAINKLQGNKRMEGRRWPDLARNHSGEVKKPVSPTDSVATADPRRNWAYVLFGKTVVTDSPFAEICGEKLRRNLIDDTPRSGRAVPLDWQTPASRSCCRGRLQVFTTNKCRFGQGNSSEGMPIAGGLRRSKSSSNQPWQRHAKQSATMPIRCPVNGSELIAQPTQVPEERIGIKTTLQSEFSQRSHIKKKKCYQILP